MRSPALVVAAALLLSSCSAAVPRPAPQAPEQPDTADEPVVEVDLQPAGPLYLPCAQLSDGSIICGRPRPLPQ